MTHNEDVNEEELSAEERERREIAEKVKAFKHSDPVTGEELTELQRASQDLRGAQRELNKERGPKILRRDPKDDGSWQRFAGAGVQLGAAIALFTLGGQWLDGKMDTEPLWTATGALLGCFGGMWAVIAAVNKGTKSKKSKDSDA